jgi:hypothetical protein
VIIQRTHNGCGPEGWIGHLVPNGLGYYNFVDPCNNHDECYGNCGSAKDVCDSTFRSEMHGSCKARKAGTAKDVAAGLVGLPPCDRVAEIYYGAVHVGGGSAFQDAQKASGCKTAANDSDSSSDSGGASVAVDSGDAQSAPTDASSTTSDTMVASAAPVAGVDSTPVAVDTDSPDAGAPAATPSATAAVSNPDDDVAAS